MMIEGLTQHQCNLLDMMFSCENPKEIYDLRQRLSQKDRHELDTLVELVILDNIDREVDKMTRFPEAEKIFRELKK
tara:strand:- start:293 stop:520 length:228 start_codon:yes stop_codon:yes gene_type:complete